MLRASGTPLRADVQPPGSTGMCLVRKGVRAVVLTAYLQGFGTILLIVGDGGGWGWHRPCSMLRVVRPWCTSVARTVAKAGHRQLARSPLSWVAATRLRPMAWSFNRRVQTSGCGIGSPFWVHGGRVRSPLAFDFGSKPRGAAVGRFVTKNAVAECMHRQLNSAPMSSPACRLVPHGWSLACEFRLVPPAG